MADPDAIYELAQRIESNIEVDKRIAALHSLQSQIQEAGYVVEADAVTSAVKVALKHANQALSTAALSFIPTYASMIHDGDGSESHSLLNHNVRIFVNSVCLLVIEKLGDQKERIREAARTALVELGNAAYAISSAQVTTSGKGKETETPLGIFERTLREAGLGAKFARIREQSVLLLPVLRQNCEKYPVRPLLPITVELLLDADATVREGARSTLVTLFSSATPAAKADLKKELEKRAVRKQTADGILREVLGAPSAATSAPVLSPPPPASYAPVTRSQSNNSHSTDVPTPISHAKPATTAAASASTTAAADDIRPVYIASRSDLERTFATMMPFFEGKESEHNWLNREQSMIKFRGLVVSGAHRQFGEAFFVAQLKSVQEGILKCVASLRTTLSMHATHLIQELAIELGDDLAPCVEAFLMHLTGMAGFTKKLIANATQEAASAIMVNVSFRPLYLQLVWQGVQDKNVATRTAAAEHLATVLTHHAAHRKHAVESHGGLDLLDKCMRKGVGDSNPAARTKSRQAFWIFYQYWPDQANVILNSLDASTKKQVAAMAPPDVETEAIVEVKPKAAAGPVRARPGGASMALLQAKKAAAMKAAQERERKTAEDAAAAHEARVAAARAALVEQQHQQELYLQQQQQQQQQWEPSAEEFVTPVAAPPKKTTGFMPIKNRSQQQQQQHQQHQPSTRLATQLSVLVSPTAHQRIETAIAVPLPTSPTPAVANHGRGGGGSGTSLSRTSSETSSQPRSPGLSPIAARTRAISSSSFSSQGSSNSARMQASTGTPRSHRPPPPSTGSALDADLENLSIAGIDDDADVTADATQQPRFPAHEDDTVQLSAPDASIDLMGMNFSSPFKIPASATSRSAKTQSVLVERQNALESLQASSTPQKRTVSTSSASSNSSTPGSAVRRSGLPRPVSTMYSSTGVQGSGVGLRSTSSRTMVSTPTKASSGAGVLENRAKRLESQQMSPVKARPEVWDWVQSLAGGKADVKVFRRLARLSSEFRVDAAATSEGDGDETVLRPGIPQNGAEKGVEMWMDGGLFTAIWDGLKGYLHVDGGVSGELQLSAQVVLLRMVENQSPLFTSTNREGELLQLVLTSISTLSTSIPGGGSSSVVARKAAIQGFESILSTWSSLTDPVLGFDSLLSSTTTFSSSASTTLIKSGFTPLLVRLPSELVLEDFLPRLQPLLNSALNSTAAEVRLGAVTMLKKLNDRMVREGVVDSHERIFGCLGLDGEGEEEEERRKRRALLDVLMYYFSKK
ncbi:Protein STU1 [Pseudozyma hubeiensis]|nr:Protein STU1 [Pseudozyma hubeiensis]